MEIRPILYNFPSLFGFIYLSIVIDNIIPIHIKMSVKSIVGIILNVVCSNDTPSGIKSIIDTVVITPAAKASDFIIILSSFFINIRSVPISVESPARDVSINPILVFIVSPI